MNMTPPKWMYWMVTSNNKQSTYQWSWINLDCKVTSRRMNITQCQMEENKNIRENIDIQRNYTAAFASHAKNVHNFQRGLKAETPPVWQINAYCIRRLADGDQNNSRLKNEKEKRKGEKRSYFLIFLMTLPCYQFSALIIEPSTSRRVGKYISFLFACLFSFCLM